MLSTASIEELSANLKRLREDDADSEIVQWLRASAPALCDIKAPGSLQSGAGYTRTLLHKSAGFEIVVIHWRAGCMTPIHDHGGSRCWFAVADGHMIVDNYLRYDSGDDPAYARIGLEGHEEMTRGGIDYRHDDAHLHRCITRDMPATTLHLYANPIEQFNAFDEKTFAVSQLTSSYDSVLP